jgi:AcrR family transcriptional regulator
MAYMSNANKKPLGRPRSIQSHQAMLQATLELLAEVGFDLMSIDAIAARAGVGKKNWSRTLLKVCEKKL